jgi:hypothetical protein
MISFIMGPIIKQLFYNSKKLMKNNKTNPRNAIKEK